MSARGPVEGDRLLASLDEDQREAVGAPLTGPRITVRAPPGSGKTRVLAARAVTLIRLRGIQPHRVRVLVFSRAAAEELRTRIGTGIGAEIAAMVDITTLHALAYRVIAAGTVGDVPDVADESEANAILKGLFIGPERRAEARATTVSAVQKVAARYAAGLASPDAHAEAKVLQQWALRLAEAGLVALWQLMPTAAVLAQDPANDRARKALHLERGFVLVDEAQDLTPLEACLVDQMGAQQVFQVADPDQAIFGWRHATGPYNVGQALELRTTYRFGREIAEMANGVVGRNAAIMCASPEESRRLDLAPRVFTTERALGEAWLQSKNGPMNDTAILTRTNREADAIAASLRGIAYRPQVTVPASVRVAMRVARLILRRTHTRAFLAVARDAGIPDTVVFKALSDAGARGDALSMYEAGFPLTMTPHPLLRLALAMLPSDSWRELVRAVWCVLTDPGSTAEDLRAPETSEMDDRTIEEAVRGAADILHDAAVSARASAETGKITVSTIHAAKGREWPVVLLALSKTWGSEPDWHKLDAEERRVIYVGITRAKNLLVTYNAEETGGLRC